MLYKIAISIFQNFGVLSHNISKHFLFFFKLAIKSKNSKIVSTRAPLAGIFCPLSNIRGNLKTTKDIGTTLSVPYRTSIWRLVWKFCQIWLFFFNWRFSDVMSWDFEPKMVVSYIDRRSTYTEASHKQKVPKQRKFNSLQGGYLGFLFCNFDL